MAILYRDEALALKRLDAIRDLEKRTTPSDKEGVVRVETLDAMFGGAPTRSAGCASCTDISRSSIRRAAR